MEKLRDHHLLDNQNRGAAGALPIVAIGIALVTEMRAFEMRYGKITGEGRASIF